MSVIIQPLLLGTPTIPLHSHTSSLCMHHTCSTCIPHVYLTPSYMYIQPASSLCMHHNTTCIHTLYTHAMCIIYLQYITYMYIHTSSQPVVVMHTSCMYIHSHTRNFVLYTCVRIVSVDIHNKRVHADVVHHACICTFTMYNASWH